MRLFPLNFRFPYKPSTSMSAFPSDLIPDILCRLLVKALLRFKCLSKKWGFLIDSDFIQRHLHQSLKTKTNLKLLLDNTTEMDDQAYSVEFDSLDNLMQFPRPFKAEMIKYHSRIFGSCNGLLAVYHRESGIVLWNPSTRKSHYLPTNTDETDDITMYHGITITPPYEYDNNTILGFGYDVINNDYKVVKMLLSVTENRFKVMVYCLKSNSWKNIKDCPYNIPYNYSNGAYTNGCLHWIGDEMNEHFGGKLIFALNLATEEYHEIPECDRDFRYKNVSVLDGSLCVFRDCSDFYGMDHVVLWVMKEYGVKESWTELIYLMRDEWLTNIFHTIAIAYSRKGDRILVDDGGGRPPAWFNLDDESGESLSVPAAPHIFSATIYVDSLVSL